MMTAFLLAVAAPARLPPVERCSGDPDFDRFRGQLERVVAARDAGGLAALMDEKVRLSFGGRFGRDSFLRQWTSPSSDRKLLWVELDRVLRLGCATAKDGNGVEYRAMPAMFVTAGGLDGFSTWVALPGAALRVSPRPGARVRMRLPAWTVLHEADHDGGQWVAVRTPKGRNGYVSTAQARSIIDYRLLFGRREGGWRITAFIAGD